jgi:RsiW-degrading membrane proteinase PrsW (M82 family)
MYLVVGAVLAFVGFVVVWILGPTRDLFEILGTTLAGSIAPSIFVLWMYFNDRFEREPIALIAYSFGWGAFSGIIAALLNTLIWVVIPLSFVVAPLVEEPLKIIGIYWLAKSKFGKEFNNHLDGLLYGVAAGSGFAALENFGYIARYSAIFGFLTIVLIRSVTPVMHALSTGFVGRWLGLSKVRYGRTTLLDLVPGLVVAMLLHALWNFMPSLGETIALLGLLLVIPYGYLLYKFAKEASRDEALWGYATGMAPKE